MESWWCEVKRSARSRGGVCCTWFVTIAAMDCELRGSSVYLVVTLVRKAESSGRRRTSALPVVGVERAAAARRARRLPELSDSSSGRSVCSPRLTTALPAISTAVSSLMEMQSFAVMQRVTKLVTPAHSSPAPTPATMATRRMNPQIIFFLVQKDFFCGLVSAPSWMPPIRRGLWNSCEAGRGEGVSRLASKGCGTSKWQRTGEAGMGPEGRGRPARPPPLMTG